MSAAVVSLLDRWERAAKAVVEPSEPHIPFMHCQAVRYFLVLEAEWNSPRTSRSRRMQIIVAFEEAAHPVDKTAIVLSPEERKMILELRGICPGWDKPKRNSGSKAPS